MNQSVATDFWENWNLFITELKDWQSPLPDPPDMFTVFGLSFISLLFACYIFRMVTVGHWSEYRGVWVPVVVMILLFLIGIAGLATVVLWTR